MSIVSDAIKKIKSWFSRLTGADKSKSVSARRRDQTRSPKRNSRRRPSQSSRNQGNRSPNRSRQPSSSTTAKKAAPRKPSRPKQSETANQKKSVPRKRTSRKASPTSKSSGAIRASAVASEALGRSRRRGSRGRRKPGDGDSPEIGEITHYFAKIKVAVVRVTAIGIKLGDSINIKGKSTDLIQKVESMQIESVDVKFARKGQLVGLKLAKPVRVGDKVYKVA